MRHSLKVLSAVMSYPTTDLQAAVSDMRAALDRESLLATKLRDRLDRILTEIATEDVYELQERYVFLFDRTRSLSLHLFEHVHGESRDRGQAMVDLGALYTAKGFEIRGGELPDYLPLFLEFLSLLPPAEAQEMIRDTGHVLEAVRLRLKKRKSAYSSVFSALMALADARVPIEVAQGVGAETIEDPDDVAALDAAWMDAEVRFGPSASTDCGKDDLAIKLRAALRPAPGVEIAAPWQPIITTNAAARSSEARS